MKESTGPKEALAIMILLVRYPKDYPEVSDFLTEKSNLFTWSGLKTLEIRMGFTKEE